MFRLKSIYKTLKHYAKLIVALLFLCFESNAQVALHGLYTPVQLNDDTTFIYLHDYLADLKFSEVKLPEGLKNHSHKKDTLILSGKLFSKLGLLNINTEKGHKSLLLINSSYKKVTISIPQKNIGSGDLRIIGSFNNWNRESEPLNLTDGNFEQTYKLEPGRYEYKLYLNENELLDPTNPEKVSNGMGSFNNVLVVKSGDEEFHGGYHVRFTAGEKTISFTPKERTGSSIYLWNNTAITPKRCDRKMSGTCHVEIPKEAKNIKRSYLRVFSFNKEQKGISELIPLEYGIPITDVSQLDRSDWHQARMYFLMVDRFNNGDTLNDLPTPDPAIQPKANYYGGDLIGVNQKVSDGFFDSLHVNTIWLSPITQNPLDAWGLWDKGEVKSKFSGYHGYWPISNLRVDFRFGTEPELNTLLDDAHADQKNVVLDYVANHVHIDHPIYQEHKDWATDLYLPDGSKNTEKWDEQRLTTWFDDHLPTLDLRKWEVVDPMVDSALFWITNYPFDGFRHDATKHIDELFWRTLTYRIRETTDKPIFQIGETYGSPQLINSYISTGMLDAQFDFNLYDAAVSAFANEEGNLEELKVKLEQGLSVYGDHHLMGNITGNQDRSRFITLSSGEARFDEDQKLAGWDREIGKPSAEAYKRLALLHAFNNAIPGIPCIYYGDEYGMPGAGDPDNRRMIQFSGLDADEAQLLEKVKKINQARASNLALLFGSTHVEVLNDKVMIITRSYLNEVVKVIINSSLSYQKITFNKGQSLRQAQKIAGEGSFNYNPNTVQVPALSYQIISFKH